MFCFGQVRLLFGRLCSWFVCQECFVCWFNVVSCLLFVFVWVGVLMVVLGCLLGCLCFEVHCFWRLLLYGLDWCATLEVGLYDRFVFARLCV